MSFSPCFLMSQNSVLTCYWVNTSLKLLFIKILFELVLPTNIVLDYQNGIKSVQCESIQKNKFLNVGTNLSV